MGPNRDYEYEDNCYDYEYDYEYDYAYDYEDEYDYEYDYEYEECSNVPGSLLPRSGVEWRGGQTVVDHIRLFPRRAVAAKLAGSTSAAGGLFFHAGQTTVRDEGLHHPRRAVPQSAWRDR
ncbi:MAG: hypothetical protein ACP5XB_04205 [Isosphaeraceae bacterium]